MYRVLELEGQIKIYIYIYMCVCVCVCVNNALTLIYFNGTNFINAECIFCLTCGPTRSWRNGETQCQLSNIADPFGDFFPFKKAPKPYLVSENIRYCRTRSCCPSMRTSLSLSLSAWLSARQLRCSTPS